VNKAAYIKLVKELKQEILVSRFQAAKLVNKELLLLYYRVGKIISSKVSKQSWGSKVVDTISSELQNNLPGLRGFSSTNLKYMRQFYETYSFLEFGQLPTDQLQNKPERQISQLPTDQFNPSKIKASAQPKSKKQPVIYPGFLNDFLSISFTHHCKIIAKTKSWEEKCFYINQSFQGNWTVVTLDYNLDSRFFYKRGKIQSNFNAQLPKVIREKAIQVFRDEYLLDFINIQNPDEVDERIVEESIVNNIKKFLMTMGKEFAFMGNQYRLNVGDEVFFIDLLFYHRSLRCLVAIELKAGKFKPEYGGKMAFYLNVLNKQVKLPEENPSIGIILCKEKNNTVVEYSFTDSKKPIGVGTYKLADELPGKFKKYLPPTEDLINIINEPTINYTNHAKPRD